MLIKSLDLAQTKLKTSKSGYEFEGYASVFGLTDSDGDVIQKGAFNLEGASPKMFFNHLHHDLPVGKWLTMEQDDYGLFVKGELTPGNSFAEDIKASMAHQTIDGMSVGFMMTGDDYEQTKSGKIIKNIPNLFEISVVTFPANSAARIETVKSALEHISDIKEFELFLRESGNISRSVATALASKAKSIFQREAAQDAQAQALINQIKQFKESLK